jgi:hypothetical protein
MSGHPVQYEPWAEPKNLFAFFFFYVRSYMDRTSGQPQVNQSLLRSNSLTLQPLFSDILIRISMLIT